MVHGLYFQPHYLTNVASHWCSANKLANTCDCNYAGITNFMQWLLVIMIIPLL